MGSALILPTVNMDRMNKHLAEISTCIAEDALALMVMDGAGWHGSSRLVIPDNIVLLTLPPCAPELNPVENIWEYPRGNSFGPQVWETRTAMMDACRSAWNKLMAAPCLIKSIGNRDWHGSKPRAAGMGPPVNS